MTSGGQNQFAEFEVESQKDPRRPLYSIKTYVCWCGWKTSQTNSNLHERTNALDLALTKHRLDHLEGKIKIVDRST